MAKPLKRTRQHDRTAAQLEVHSDIMADLISKGWDRLEASAEAYRRVLAEPVGLVVARANELRAGRVK